MCVILSNKSILVFDTNLFKSNEQYLRSYKPVQYKCRWNGNCLVPYSYFFFITGELYKSAAIKLKQKKDVAPKFKQIEDMQYLSNGLM